MVGQVSECVYCGQSVLMAADGAWEGVSGGACGCSESLEKGGTGEHEAPETGITSDRVRADAETYTAVLVAYGDLSQDEMQAQLQRAGFTVSFFGPGSLVEGIED